jgi:hypothetical protein
VNHDLVIVAGRSPPSGPDHLVPAGGLTDTGWWTALAHPFSAALTLESYRLALDAGSSGTPS